MRQLDLGLDHETLLVIDLLVPHELARRKAVIIFWTVLMGLSDRLERIPFSLPKAGRGMGMLRSDLPGDPTASMVWVES